MSVAKLITRGAFLRGRPQPESSDLKSLSRAVTPDTKSEVPRGLGCFVSDRVMAQLAFQVRAVAVADHRRCKGSGGEGQVVPL
jgi:hypothetical protein